MTALDVRGGTATSRSFWLGVAAYLVPSFPIAYAWHLVVFAPAYEALRIYRPDPIIPFGFASMLIQGLAFSSKAGARLWAFARDPVVVVHHACGRRQEHHDLGTDLC